VLVTWETPCPARADRTHCPHWYDGEACCGCHDPATADYDEVPEINAPATVEGPPCPTCSGPIRETVGMICPACGTDYAPEPCPFCEIVAGRAPATIFDDWADAMVIAPRNPVTPGHRLVIPKAHVRDLAANPLVSAMVMERAALHVLEWRVGDCNVITSRGAAATQSVTHLHLHIVPRVDGDGLHLPWTGQTIEAPTTTKDGS
jgi:histidine triad (HIT) family protein